MKPWRITEDFYNKKREDYRSQQVEIQHRFGSLQEADEDYYTSAEYLIQLANRAKSLFESSEAPVKRQFLKLLLQNCQLEGKNVSYSYRKPFHLFNKRASRQNWLPVVDTML